jgi:hypothetical protein
MNFDARLCSAPIDETSTPGQPVGFCKFAVFGEVVAFLDRAYFGGCDFD